jgi:hypothetical protein
MAKARKYYTLVSQRLRREWCIEFGDYDRQTVVEEREDILDGLEHSDDPADQLVLFKIITTADDQDAIEAAVAKLNGVAQ